MTGTDPHSVDDDFCETTVQFKKRVAKLPNGTSDSVSIPSYDEQLVDIDLDGYEMEAEDSNPMTKQRASGRVLPQWSERRDTSNSRGDNLFKEYAFK